jgi:hypothetical protein
MYPHVAKKKLYVPSNSLSIKVVIGYRSPKNSGGLSVAKIFRARDYLSLKVLSIAKYFGDRTYTICTSLSL